MKTPFHFLALLSVLGLGLVLSPGQAPVAQAGLARLFFLKGTLSDFDGVEIRITDHWGRTWAFPRKLLSAGLELRPGIALSIRADRGEFRLVRPYSR